MEGAGRRQGPVDIDRREQVHRWSKAMDVIAKPIYEGPRLTVFISYGHDGFTAVSERIALMLRTRGHRVWMDSKRLKGGDDWASEMAAGILDVQNAGDNGRFLYMMAPWGVRDAVRHAGNGGFCLNEIAAAVGRSLQDHILCTVLCPCSLPATLPQDMLCFDISSMFDSDDRLQLTDWKYQSMVKEAFDKKLDAGSEVKAQEMLKRRGQHLDHFMCGVRFSRAMLGLVGLLEQPMSPGRQIANPDAVHAAAAFANVHATPLGSIRPLHDDDTSIPVEQVKELMAGDEVRIFVMGHWWTKALARYIADHLPSAIREGGPTVLVEFTPELLFHENIELRSAYVEHAMQWAVGAEQIPLCKQAQVYMDSLAPTAPAATAAAASASGVAAASAEGGKGKGGGGDGRGAYDDIEDGDGDDGGADYSLVQPRVMDADSGAGESSSAPSASVGEGGGYGDRAASAAVNRNIFGRAVLLLSREACKQASVPALSGECRPFITQAQTRGCQIIPVRVSQGDIPLQIVNIQYIYGSGCMKGTEDENVKRGHAPGILAGKARQVVQDLEKAVIMGLDDRGEAATRMRQLEQLTTPVEFAQQIGSEFATVPRPGLHTALMSPVPTERAASAEGGSTDRVVILEGDPGRGLAEYVGWLVQTQADTGGYYFADTGEEHCASLRRAILTLSSQLATSTKVILPTDGEKEHMPFRDAVLGKRQVDPGVFVTPQKIAQTGSEEELFQHFLLGPMQTTAKFYHEHSVPMPAKTIIISKPEVIRTENGARSLIDMLCTYLAHIPVEFRFVLVLREPVQRAGLTVGCRVEPFGPGSPAIQAHMEDMITHVRGELMDHQRNHLNDSSGKSHVEVDEEALHKFAQDIVSTKGNGNFQYIMRILRLIKGRNAPIDVEAEMLRLPNGERAALESLLEEKYMQSSGGDSISAPSAEYEAIRPVLEVLVALQSQISRDEMIQILSMRKGNTVSPGAWRQRLDAIDPQIASINAQVVQPIKGMVFDVLCGYDVTIGEGKMHRTGSSDASAADRADGAAGGGGRSGESPGFADPGTQHIHSAGITGQLTRQSSQIQRVAPLQLSQAAGHNLLAAWCAKRHEVKLRECTSRDNPKCIRFVSDDGPIRYSESSFHQLSPYVLKYLLLHLNTAVHEAMAAAWPLSRSQRDFWAQVVEDPSFESFRWAKKTLDYREIGMKKLYRDDLDKPSMSMLVSQAPESDFLLRWSSQNSTYCVTVRNRAGRKGGPCINRLIYRKTARMADTGAEIERCSVSSVNPVPETTFKDLPAFIAKFTMLSKEDDLHLGNPLLKEH